MTHLDESTARRYRERTLGADALLDVSEHLAQCPECRIAASGGKPRATAVIDAMTHDAAHLDGDQLAAYIDDTLTPFEWQTVDSHLEQCPSCRADLDDLRETAAAISVETTGPRRSRWHLAAAIAAMLVLPIVFWTMRRTEPAPQPPPVVAKPEDPLLLEARKGRIQIPPRTQALHRDSGTLMGTATPAFDVTAPAGTLVRDTRPQFTWTPFANAETYTVEIYRDGTLVAQSPALTSTEWKAAQDLERGRDYVWQVVATKNGERTIAPKPPLAEARFGIIDDASLQRITEADRRYANDPLLRALASAREGLLDDARAQLGDASGPAADALRNALR